MIKLDDLQPLGFDSSTLARIEPHFHVLNASLGTCMNVGHTAERAGPSVAFHQTADRHEQIIELILTDDLPDKVS